MRRIYTLLIALFCLVSGGCAGTPQGVKPVTNFELDRYQGKWYEIARLDHSYERGLSNVSAVYAPNENGEGISITNRGYNSQKRAWSEALGKGYFVGDPHTAHLKVSFFGPFYGSYIVFGLDPNYQFAFVTSNDKNSLWLLSRTPTTSQAVKDRFVSDAGKLGYDVDQLIWVDQYENQAQLKDDEKQREISQQQLME